MVERARRSGSGPLAAHHNPETRSRRCARAKSWLAKVARFDGVLWMAFRITYFDSPRFSASTADTFERCQGGGDRLSW